MKRIISFILIISMVISLNIDVYATSTEPESEVSDNMIEFLKEDNFKYLVSRHNYSYMNFTEKFQSDAWSLLLLGMANVYIDSGEKPDVDKYVKCLVNLIVTHDMDCAGDMFEQKKLDNLKSAKDYAIDIATIGKNAVSVITGIGKNVIPLESEITLAIECLSTFIANTDTWKEEISKLETIVQDYSNHDEFLQVIEENAEGDLKEATNKLRTALEKSMKLRLEMYQNATEENIANLEEYFFTNTFFELAKEAPDYAKDLDFKFCIDSCENIVSCVDNVNSSLELGFMIGTLAGDVLVGGENLIDRVLEMMAIYDISNIMQDKVFEISQDFGSDVNNLETINRFVNMSSYLVGCRVRGEYCLHSIIIKDARLLSKFKTKSVEDAKKAYDFKVDKMANIQEDLKSIIYVNTDQGKEINDGQYTYYNGKLYSSFRMYTKNGRKAILAYWDDTEQEAVEYFMFDWVDGQFKYKVKGSCSNKIYELKAIPTENGVKIKVVCTEGKCNSWEDKKESKVWSNVEYKATTDEDPGYDDICRLKENIEAEDRIITEKLQNAMSQSQMNKAAHELYNLWYDGLYELWGKIKWYIGEEAYEQLYADNVTWENNLKVEMKKAGQEYEGGSMQGMQETLCGVNIIQDRYYYLIDWVDERYRWWE